ncbi:hypothetical protein [Dactylosporangium sp. NPDC000521]|uniref:hypothetical protein n=1 Tax=Dactylosporangium sp. NPDC000521 TaxID=3363975 RepID=UPI0036C2B5F5
MDVGERRAFVAAVVGVAAGAFATLWYPYVIVLGVAAVLVAVMRRSRELSLDPPRGIEM